MLKLKKNDIVTIPNLRLQTLFWEGVNGGNGAPKGDDSKIYFFFPLEAFYLVRIVMPFSTHFDDKAKGNRKAKKEKKTIKKKEKKKESYSNKERRERQTKVLNTIQYPIISKTHTLSLSLSNNNNKKTFQREKKQKKERERSFFLLLSSLYLIKE